MKFLSSKELSMFCFLVNCFFAITSLYVGNYIFFLMSMFFAIICVSNVFNKNK